MWQEPRAQEPTLAESSVESELPPASRILPALGTPEVRAALKQATSAYNRPWLRLNGWQTRSASARTPSNGSRRSSPCTASWPTAASLMTEHDSQPQGLTTSEAA